MSYATSRVADFIVDRINSGVLVVDRDMRVVAWNRFLEVHSGRSAAEVVGSILFDCFPELPRRWLERKVRAVMVLKNPGFTSWQQRPYLFRFAHHRPVTGGIDYMQQDCSLLPMLNDAGEVDLVCIVVTDATDTSITQARLNEALRVIGEQSVRDGLTNVFNRRKLEEELHREYQRARRYRSPLSFAMLDIDHFKRVNDTHGHMAGDEAIRHVAAISGRCLRETDCLGRYGGEEFGIILPHVGSAGAIIAAERIRAAVAGQAVTYETTTIPLTISIGVTEGRADTADYQTLIREADSALYAAKTQGRNRVRAFSPSAEESSNARAGEPS